MGALTGSLVAVTDADDPIEQLMEAFVYAPVGLVLDARQNWGTYVERGKSQVTIGRFLARAAAQRGSATAESMVERLANDVAQVVVDLFGIDLSPDAAPSGFPIADYEERTAADIVAQLGELSVRDLERVRARERDGKARVTVLRRIDVLLAHS